MINDITCLGFEVRRMTHGQEVSAQTDGFAKISELTNAAIGV